MQEYKDGSYGEPMEVGKLMEKLFDHPELAKTKTIHIGTLEELDNQKMSSGNAKQINDKLGQLERKINRIMVHLNIEAPGEILVVD